MSSTNPLQDFDRTVFPSARRRLAAAAIDFVVLWLVAELLAAFYEPEFIALGPRGRWVGLLFFLAYIGGQNSTLTGGHTFGKRWLGLRVVDKNGRSLSLERSMARAVLLAIPFFFRGTFFFPESPSLALAAHLVLVTATIGYGGILFASYWVGSRNGQALHDRLLGVYVVRRDAELPTSFREASGGSLARIALVLWLIVCAGGGAAQWWFWGGKEWTRIVTWQRRLAALEGVRDAEVFSGTFHFRNPGGAHTLARYVEVRATVDHKITDFDQEALRFAEALFASAGPDDVDAVRISVGYEFDLLAARRRWSRSYVRTPAEWRSLLSMNATQARAIGAPTAGRGERDSSHQAVELRGIERTHLASLFLGHAAKHLLHHASRLRPVAPVMRVVRRPHHVVHSNVVPVAHRVMVDHKSDSPVPSEVKARRVFELYRQPPPIAPPAIVHLL